RWKDKLEILHLVGFAMVAVSVLCSRLWTSTRARTRWRLRWVAASAAAGLIPPALLYLLPLAWGIPLGPAGEMSVLPLAILPLGFAAALFQERTVDLGSSLRVAVRWLTLASLFAAAGLASSWLVAYLPGGLASAGIVREVLLPIGIASVLAARFFRPLAKRIDGVLGPKPVELARLLLGFRSELQGEIFIEPLGNRLEDWLARVGNVRPVALLVEGPTPETFVPACPSGGAAALGGLLDLSEGELGGLAQQDSVLLQAGSCHIPGQTLESLRRAGFRYLFPLVFQARTRAILLVGPHRDGSSLDAEELDAFSALAGQAARSVEAARLYKEIEDRGRREEHMRRETEAILESCKIGMLLVEDSGLITAANGASSEILGRPALIGQRVQEVLPRGLLMLLDRSARQEGEGRHRVFRYSLGAADGVRRVVNVTRSILGVDSAARRVYALDDVSEEVGRERKMARQDHLAAMGMLASEVAHEVNTPLTGIASYAQMLMARMKSRLPEMELLKKIENQAFRAAGIAGSVLTFARRREAEGFEIFEPGPVIAESLALFEPHLKGKRIRLSTERAPVLPSIRGHKGRIQQVVLNLMMNAAQALPSGGEIRLATERDGESVRVRISDNGVGIPAANLPRIFEPFFTSRNEGEGTGLGLAVVKQIVDEHRGQIHVETVEGAGSTFTVSFPAADPSSKEAARGA
ncbi:MAG TPA: ATP-binding protein, partial [Candidatus Polarisedimenticolia bacterium]|nr:ATP-binding protein [Candidatus Polarisedimenticolia bacterium]